MSRTTTGGPLISVILPVYNCAPFIRECLESVLAQTLDDDDEGTSLDLEISIYEDGSTDNTLNIIEDIRDQNKDERISWIISQNVGGEKGKPKGVGFGRNRAANQATGEYFCFCDGDDVMEPNRILKQYLVARESKDCLIGTPFTRIPPGSTSTFTKWANTLSEAQLMTQIYLSFGPTIVMPSWFCHRQVYERIPGGGFSELGKGTPEDLIFFYQHLDKGGGVKRVGGEGGPLMKYRYHEGQETLSVRSETILTLRLQRLEHLVLSKWGRFTIWNAGKRGRRFYKSLKPENREKVEAFCDVDRRKLEQGYYVPYPPEEAYPGRKRKVPILRPEVAKGPFIICVKVEFIWDETGPFRQILDNLSLKEGVDYYYFN